MLEIKFLIHLKNVQKIKVLEIIKLQILID